MTISFALPKKALMLTLTCLLMIHIAVSGQGILFEELDWEEVLNKAKMENKPVFVDFYTNWCLPCKKMEKEVFILSEVGQVFNEQFINYKINAEKGTGVTLAKKFRVNSYPTYIFLNGAGDVIYRVIGYMPAQKFLEEAKVAGNEFNDPKPLAVWEDEYNLRKTDPAFIEEYIQKRHKAKLDCADLLDSLTIVAGPDSVFTSDIFLSLGEFKKLNTDGPFFEILFQNRPKVLQIFKDKRNMNVRLDQFLVNMAKTDIERAGPKSNEPLLNRIMEVIRNLHVESTPVEWSIGESLVRYYELSGEKDKLQSAWMEYSKSLLDFDHSILYEKDSIAAEQFIADVASGKLKNYSDSLKYSNQLDYISSLNQVSYAYKIRSLSNSVLNFSDDPEMIDKALHWMEKAESLSDNFTIFEVKAGLLYKSGRVQEGIAAIEKSLALYNKMVEKYNSSLSEKVLARLLQNLEIMKEGKPLPESK